jgi:hypothetical protein
VIVGRGGASEELGDVGAGGGEGVADVAEDVAEVVLGGLVVRLGVTADGEALGVILGLIAVVG